jgi:hypothetical protein
MKSGGNENPNGRGRDSDPFQPAEQGRDNQPVRDKPGLIADGDGHRSGSLKSFKTCPTERIFEGSEDLFLGIFC